MGSGKQIWIIPDCELPPPGEGLLKGHESVIVLNDGARSARIEVTLFFTDRPCKKGIVWEVGAERVRCFRMNEPKDMGGFEVPLETQYAMKLESDENVVVQYGRLDNRQTNLAYYTAIGYSEERRNHAGI